jgi:hypothetical protein
MAVVIPVRPVIKGGIAHCGFTRLLKESVRVSPSRLKRAISVIRFPWIPFPVVSMSTTVYNAVVLPLKSTKNLPVAFSQNL